jgi:hypothetical protein
MDEDAYDEKHNEERSDTAADSCSHLVTTAVSIVGSPPDHARTAYLYDSVFHNTIARVGH